MKKTAVNPYLPFWETVPDGEPHVFGDRVYVFGSHDKRDGSTFCEEDYVGWSAPIDDLGNWRYEGVIYKKSQDPINGAAYEGVVPPFETSPFDSPTGHFLYAPDVAQGADGRYYLYYALDFVNVISVAVCDTPAGEYEFYGFIQYADGNRPRGARLFDPAVLHEGGITYLYYGFCPEEHLLGMEAEPFEGAMMVKLAADMHTIISNPVCVAKGVEQARGTLYEEHPFFEASSIRKIGEWYYFVYSSLQGHELCYGMSRSPEGPFEFKGVIVSNGDIGYKGNKLAVNYMGNNHGGLEVIKGQPYIFWHRHTHGTQFSRQGCADKISIGEDGTIEQIEITSCGLNDGGIPAKKTFGAYIACQITQKARELVGMVQNFMPGEARPQLPSEMPYVTEELCETGEKGLYPYIHNLRTGAVVGVKYIKFDGDEKYAVLTVRGKGTMGIRIGCQEGELLGSVTVNEKGWKECKFEITQIKAATEALYFVLEEGCLDFAECRFDMCM